MSCGCNENNKKIEEIVKRIGGTKEKSIPVLQAVQAEFRYISKESIAKIAEISEMSEAQLFGVATFYSQFRLKPVGERIIKVCHGTACHVSGASGVTEAFEERLGIKDGENTEDMKYTLDNVACVGCCSLAPVVVIDNNGEESVFAKIDRKKAAGLIDDIENGEA